MCVCVCSFSNLRNAVQPARRRRGESSAPLGPSSRYSFFVLFSIPFTLPTVPVYVSARSSFSLTRAVISLAQESVTSSVLSG